MKDLNTIYNFGRSAQIFSSYPYNCLHGSFKKLFYVTANDIFYHCEANVLFNKEANF